MEGPGGKLAHAKRQEHSRNTNMVVKGLSRVQKVHGRLYNIIWLYSTHHPLIARERRRIEYNQLTKGGPLVVSFGSRGGRVPPTQSDIGRHGIVPHGGRKRDAGPSHYDDRSVSTCN